MAALYLNGTPVPLRDWSEEEPLPIGTTYRAFDGTDHSSISGYKRRWSGTTVELTAAEKQTTRAILESLPITATGPAMEDGSFDVRAEIRGADLITDAGVIKWYIHFWLVER